MWWWAIALALHHQAAESLPVEPHPCSHLCQGSFCLPSLATGKSKFHALTLQVRLLHGDCEPYDCSTTLSAFDIPGCDIPQTYCLQVSCIFATGMHARNRRKQSGLTHSKEIKCNHSSLPAPRASQSASDRKCPATRCLYHTTTGCC